MIYEYVCAAGHVIEAHVKMSGEGAPTSCPVQTGVGFQDSAGTAYAAACGKPLKRILSAPSPFFPGAGSWRGA